MGADRLPVPGERYDVTQGGTVLCAQARRLAWAPNGHTLYSNCNNGGAGPGSDQGLEVWAVAPDGTLRFVEYHSLRAMDGEITDPVLHPSGRWLYQPVGTTDPGAPEGPGAYIIVFAVAPNGTLRFHTAVPVRTLSPRDSVRNVSHSHIFPVTISIDPNGRHAYVALAAILNGGRTAHESITYKLADGGGRLVQIQRRPAALPTTYSSPEGGTLVRSSGGSSSTAISRITTRPVAGCSSSTGSAATTS